jgi:hypothetical protein
VHSRAGVRSACASFPFPRQAKKVSVGFITSSPLVNMIGTDR